MTVLQRIAAVEGMTLELEPALRERLRQTAFRLHRELRLSFPPLQEDERGMRIWNLVGTIDIGGGFIVDVEPKSRPGDHWIRSLLSLLVGEDPVDVAGERSSAQSPTRPDILEAIAAIYAARLERALRRDGPLSIMQRVSESSEMLRGRLDVARWLNTFFATPTRFPVAFSTLAFDNEYTRALAIVCLRLGRLSRRHTTRARLLELAGLLRPGCPDPTGAPTGVEYKRLPSQWAVYQPAWSIACAMLARQSLLGPEGLEHGVSIAIEPWPLLERLLERSVDSAVQQGRTQGRDFAMPPKALRRLLTKVEGGGPYGHNVEPDALIAEGGAIVASFEAKYRDYDPTKGPERLEIYQAVAAARAVSSPLAVLVYPGSFETARWVVEGAGPPHRMAAVGLGMFSYVQGGERPRGASLLQLVSS